MALKATLSDIGIDDTHMHFKVKIQRRNMTATFILSAPLENCRTTVSLSDLTILNFNVIQQYSAEIERKLNYQSPIVLLFVPFVQLKKRIRNLTVSLFTNTKSCDNFFLKKKRAGEEKRREMFDKNMLATVLLLLHPPSVFGVPLPSIIWKSQPVRAPPVVQNFYGSANLNKYSAVALGPITLGGFNGNFINSTIRISGEPVIVTEEAWRGCEGERRGNLRNKNATVVNTVRMPFEKRAVIQRFVVTSSSKKSSSVELSMYLDGPFFRTCDEENNADSGSCGWGTSMPVDKENFVIVLQDSETYVIKDKLTSAVAAAKILSEDCRIDSLDKSADDGGLDMVAFCDTGGDNEIAFDLIFAVGNRQADAIAQLANITNDIDVCFDEACTLYQDRFNSAFDKTNDHFSGSLPVITSNDKKLDDLYYWSTFAQVSLERTSFPSFDRQYVISEGQSNSFAGDSYMGGSGQFVWDLSFSGATLSLLDPDSVKLVLVILNANGDYSNYPISLPQMWDAYEPYPNLIGAGQYAFDYIATFLFYHSYVTTNKDGIEMLRRPVQNNHNPERHYTGLDFLRRIVWNFQSYPHPLESPYLADYGSNKRSFLEAVPTYTNVIPALQMANAGMLLGFARILEEIGTTENTSSEGKEEQKHTK